MKTHITLAEALHRAGTELNQALPPPQLAARVHAALVRRPLAVPSPGWGTPPLRAALRHRWAWPVTAAGASCAAVLVVSVLLMLRHPAVESSPPELRLSGFVPVVPTELWPSEDAPAWLVRTELRRDRLAALGLPFDPTRAADSVRAELLVRASGEVLAVRFVQ